MIWDYMDWIEECGRVVAHLLVGLTVLLVLFAATAAPRRKDG